MVPSRSYNCASVNKEAYQSLGKLKYPNPPKQNTKIRHGAATQTDLLIPEVPQCWLVLTRKYVDKTHGCVIPVPFLLVPLNFSIQIMSFCAKKLISHTCSICIPSLRLKLDRVMLTAMALCEMETFCIRLCWSKTYDGPAKGFVGLKGSLVRP